MALIWPTFTHASTPLKTEVGTVGTASKFKNDSCKPLLEKQNQDFEGATLLRPVPTVPTCPHGIWGQVFKDEPLETRMDTGFVAIVPTVPTVPTQKDRDGKREHLKIGESSPETPTQKRFNERLSRFKDRGMGQAAAHDLASRLARRDRDLDDRRHCQECRGLVYGRCVNRMAVLDVLHRCDYFRG